MYASPIGEELGASLEELGLAVVSSAGMLVGIIVYVRLAGLRSFSKMSSFDFTVTVAFGSLLAAVSISSSSLAVGVVAAGALLGTQACIALLRQRTTFGQIVDNTPMVLMARGEYFDDNLRQARVTRSDVSAKLREANALDISEVRAVVLETTGDVSVLHGTGPLHPSLLEGIVGGERVLQME